MYIYRNLILRKKSYKEKQEADTRWHFLFQFQVILQFCTDSPCYVTRGMTLKHLPSGKERFIYQLQYTDWPDHGCPENIHGFLSK